MDVNLTLETIRVVILVLRTLCYKRHWIKYINNPGNKKMVYLLSDEQ